MQSTKTKPALKHLLRAGEKIGLKECKKLYDTFTDHACDHEITGDEAKGLKAEELASKVAAVFANALLDGKNEVQNYVISEIIDMNVCDNCPVSFARWEFLSKKLDGEFNKDPSLKKLSGRINSLCGSIDSVMDNDKYCRFIHNLDKESKRISFKDLLMGDDGAAEFIWTIGY